jgi:hypothetical protein
VAEVPAEKLCVETRGSLAERAQAAATVHAIVTSAIDREVPALWVIMAVYGSGVGSINCCCQNLSSDEYEVDVSASGAGSAARTMFGTRMNPADLWAWIDSIEIMDIGKRLSSQHDARRMAEAHAYCDITRNQQRFQRLAPPGQDRVSAAEPRDEFAAVPVRRGRAH